MTIISIEKSESESLFDYHKRLVYGKLVDKTLADVDYTELSELVYGQSYSSDVARRMMYGSRRTLELMESEKIGNIESDNIINELDAKIIELRKERQKYLDQRREFNKLVVFDGRREHLYDALIQSANNLNQTVGTIFNDNKLSVNVTGGTNEAVLVFSDWHYGMITENVFNTYNTDVCRARVRKVINDAECRLVLHRCKRLHIVILGDMIHGGIHTSARVASEELVCDQIMQVSEILAQSIDRLSKSVQEVFVYCTYGNHGRTIPNKNDNIHRDNMERLIPWWLECRLKQRENIIISSEDNKEFLFINAAGHDICASHGDLDNVKSSPRILTVLFNKQYGKNVEYILLGDKHHRESFEEMGVTAMVCGALCGSDDYANEKRLFSSPSQLLLIVNPDIGIDAEYRIQCK